MLVVAQEASQDSAMNIQTSDLLAQLTTQAPPLVDGDASDYESLLSLIENDWILRGQADTATMAFSEIAARYWYKLYLQTGSTDHLAYYQALMKNVKNRLESIHAEAGLEDGESNSRLSLLAGSFVQKPIYGQLGVDEGIRRDFFEIAEYWVRQTYVETYYGLRRFIGTLDSTPEQNNSATVLAAELEVAYREMERGAERLYEIGRIASFANDPGRYETDTVAGSGERRTPGSDQTPEQNEQPTEPDYSLLPPPAERRGGRSRTNIGEDTSGFEPYSRVQPVFRQGAHYASLREFLASIDWDETKSQNTDTRWLNGREVGGWTVDANGQRERQGRTGRTRAGNLTGRNANVRLSEGPALSVAEQFAVTDIEHLISAPAPQTPPLGTRNWKAPSGTATIHTYNAARAAASFLGNHLNPIHTEMLLELAQNTSLDKGKFHPQEFQVRGAALYAAAQIESERERPSQAVLDYVEEKSKDWEGSAELQKAAFDSVALLAEFLSDKQIKEIAEAIGKDSRSRQSRALLVALDSLQTVVEDLDPETLDQFVGSLEDTFKDLEADPRALRIAISRMSGMGLNGLDLALDFMEQYDLNLDAKVALVERVILPATRSHFGPFDEQNPLFNERSSYTNRITALISRESFPSVASPLIDSIKWILPPNPDASWLRYALNMTGAFNNSTHPAILTSGLELLAHLLIYSRTYTDDDMATAMLRARKGVQIASVQATSPSERTWTSQAKLRVVKESAAVFDALLSRRQNVRRGVPLQIVATLHFLTEDSGALPGQRTRDADSIFEARVALANARGEAFEAPTEEQIDERIAHIADEKKRAEVKARVLAWIAGRLEMQEDIQERREAAQRSNEEEDRRLREAPTALDRAQLDKDRAARDEAQVELDSWRSEFFGDRTTDEIDQALADRTARHEAAAQRRSIGRGQVVIQTGLEHLVSSLEESLEKSVFEDWLEQKEDSVTEFHANLAVMFAERDATPFEFEMGTIILDQIEGRTDREASDQAFDFVMLNRNSRNELRAMQLLKEKCERLACYMDWDKEQWVQFFTNWLSWSEEDRSNTLAKQIYQLNQSYLEQYSDAPSREAYEQALVEISETDLDITRLFQ